VPDWADLENSIRVDINKTYEDSYIIAAAALEYFEPAEFARLGHKLKGRGLGLSRWEHTVHARGRKERERLSQTAAARAASANTAPGTGIRSLKLEDPAPSGAPVVVSDVLDQVCAFVERCVILSRDAAVAVTLWIVLSYLVESLEIAPRLAILSPQPECGKSTLLTILGMLCNRSITASNISPSAIFRVIEAVKCSVLLMDEIDSYVTGKNAQSETGEILRGILNSGHARPSAFVIRTERIGNEFVPCKFSTFALVAHAAIGSIPQTWRSRAIVINQKRKLRTDKVERLTRRRFAKLSAEAAELQAKIARLVKDNLAAFRNASPTIPAGLGPRAEDNYEPLLAIAELAADGPTSEWAKRARAAALALAADGDARETQALPIQLLRDIKENYFAGQKPPNADGEDIGASDLLQALLKLDASPWPTVNRNGRPLSARRLADMLGTFGIYPKKTAARNVYERAALIDVFLHYPPDPPDLASIAPQLLRPVGENGDPRSSTDGGSTNEDSLTESRQNGIMEAESGGSGDSREKTQKVEADEEVEF
jgi:putative DNA primase/helicase